MRGIKPEFWTDEKIMALSLGARLLFIGMWHLACDYGHVSEKPVELKARIFPMDPLTLDEMKELVQEVVTQGLVEDRGEYLAIPHFERHQRLDKRYMTSCAHCEHTPEPRGGHDGDTTGSRGDHAGATRAPKSSPDEREREREREPRGSARKRGTRLPDIFPITDEMRTWGREHAAHVDASKEHEKFCDYWRGVAGQRGTKLDWIATWRNWMRRAEEDAERRAPARNDDTPDWMLA